MLIYFWTFYFGFNKYFTSLNVFVLFFYRNNSISKLYYRRTYYHWHPYYRVLVGWGDYIGASELDIWCSNLKRYIFVKTKKFAKPFLPFIWCPGRIFEANKKWLKILWHCPLKKYMSTAGNQDVCVYWLDVDGSTVHYISGLGTRSFQKNATFLHSFPFFIKERNVFWVLSHSFQKNATFLRSFPFFIKERNVFCVLSHSL